MDEDTIIWNIIDTYIKDNDNYLVKHHLDSYNNFFEKGIQQVLREKNPISIMKQQDETTKNFNYRCNLYLGGKNGDRLYYGKPVIYDDMRTHYMFPNEARLRNMTYGFSIHYDVEVEFFIKKEDTETSDEKSIVLGSSSNIEDSDYYNKKTIVLEKMFMGNFPIMLQSKMCVLHGLDRGVRFSMGECKNEMGGYFIIDGKEKTVVCQEKFGDNMLYIRDKVNDIYSHSAEIRSVSEDASKPVRTVAVRMVSPSPKYQNKNIVVNVPNVRKPVPLFILMRAFGIISDKKIIEMCLLDLNSNESMMELFIPSIYDAGTVFTQEAALKYISTFTKGIRFFR